MKKTIQAVVNRNIETKESCATVTDGVEILHNNFVLLDNTLLQTSQGTQDSPINHVSNRVGDEINLKSVTCKMMVEVNERYSDVTFRLMLVKSSRGDVPTRGTLFNGLTGNKMMDTINTERYSILKQRTFQMKQAPQSVVSPTEQVPGPLGSGTYYGGAASQLSRATKMVTICIPGKKFARNGKIVYDAGGTQQKFFDYNLVLYAYSNYSTAQDVYNIARVNDYIRIMKFKDA